MEGTPRAGVSALRQETLGVSLPSPLSPCPRCEDPERPSAVRPEGASPTPSPRHPGPGLPASASVGNAHVLF